MELDNYNLLREFIQYSPATKIIPNVGLRLLLAYNERGRSIRYEIEPSPTGVMVNYWGFDIYMN